jgi:hypothetical protein
VPVEGNDFPLTVLPKVAIFSAAAMERVILRKGVTFDGGRKPPEELAVFAIPEVMERFRGLEWEEELAKMGLQLTSAGDCCCCWKWCLAVRPRVASRVSGKWFF